MSTQTSPRSAIKLSNIFKFATDIKVSTNKPIRDCVLALRESPRSSVWFGGYNIRVSFPKAREGSPDIPFMIEYYRQSGRSSRSSHLAQNLRGIFYRKNNQTYVLARASFTLIEVLGFWIASTLAVVSIALLVFTQHIVALILIAAAACFLLGAGGLLVLNRYWLIRIIRRCMNEY